MAGWVQRGGIGKQLYSYKSFLEVAVLIFIATCASVPTLDAQPGFVSLDCGGAQTAYNDSHGLLWVTDDTYINTGNSFQQQGYPDGKPYLGSFRDFPEGQSKHCYNLDTEAWTYLVRASFYMDPYELKKRQPFEFIFSFDATDWFTVTSGDGTSQLSSLLIVREAIFHPPYVSTSFCLRPVHGVPFISSLELRPLDAWDYTTNLYYYRGCLSQFLALGRRYNAGAQNVPDVRYPEDPYDRIWTTPDAFVARNLTSFTSTQPRGNTSLNEYKVPPEVMQDAWLFRPENISERTIIVDNVFADGPQVYSTPSQYALVIVYSQILNTSLPGGQGPYDGAIYLGYDANSIQVDSDYITFSTEPHEAVTPFVTLTNLNAIYLSLRSDAPSSSATMNAVEIYTQLAYNASITNSTDVAVIEALKTMFSLTDWQGDPCVPVPYNWLSCSLPDATVGLGQQCNCNESRPVFATFYNVTSLNLSNMTRIIGHPSALPSERLYQLNTMSITSSEVDDQAFLFLVNYTSSGLVTLNLSYNAIETLPRAIDWAGTDNVAFKNLTTLDLSHNDLAGVLSSFEDLPFSASLQNLNLSYNRLTSFPDMRGSTTIQSLVTLNLSHNRFYGDISSLDNWVQMNSGSLKELDISNNNVSGKFSSDIYFSLPNLTFANFDHNSIEGILNLSIWYAALQEAALELAAIPTSNNFSMPSVTHQLFSFMNNNIVDIVPIAKGFDSTTYSLFKGYQASGVMLNGNPYCHHIKSSVQRYLCRQSIWDTFTEDHKSNRKEILIISICGGILALLLFSISSATLWKLWKQVYTLRGIQQALADRKVQPPFYQYNDLKIATKDFHKNNKLGHGGFGVVYKGVLADETLAVKKLFNSPKVQVIDDFLNEVVLLTGIKHRNLVQLRGCCIKDKQRILVYEYAEKGNLAEALWGSQVHGELNWKQRLNICVGVARGLSYLHEELQPTIIHRDIKPSNILLDNNFDPKIADFGLARHVSDETNQAHYTQIAGTLGYFAPEYAMQGQVSEKTDVYSYGILILEVVSGRKCIDSTRPIEEKFLKDWVSRMRQKSLLFDILQPKLREDCDIAEVIRVINIALLCVQHHPERRPTMSQVVTMFLGNMDIDVCSDEFDNIHSNFRDFMATVSHDAEHPALQIIEEESPVLPLLDLDSQSSFNIGSSRSRPTIELSPVCGR